jgi:3-methyladenine DNA glycosylase AlkD
MPPKKKKSDPTMPTKSDRQPPLPDDVSSIIASLQRLATTATREGLVRFAIPNHRAFGVSMGNIQKLAKQLGRNHELALKLWETGWYEARLLTAFVDDPACVTPAQMDRWCRDFDNWAVCDTLCFHLFDRTPHAFRKVAQWSTKRNEFEKRAAFALLWALALHDKQTGDAPFVESLVIVERAATDERNFVKKAVNMALRAIGTRNATLHAAAVDVAQRLAASPDATARWVGKDALRKLASPATTKRLAARQRRAR